MSNNNRLIIADGTRLIENFEETKETESLRLAYQKLAGVQLYKEADVALRQKLRAVVSNIWIRILNNLDKYLSPSFDPENTVSMQCPTYIGKGGKEYPPNIKAESIADSQDRSGFIKSAKEHGDKEENYEMQLQLSHIEKPLSIAARNYFILAYPANDNDKKELATLIKNSLNSKTRQQELLQFFK